MSARPKDEERGRDESSPVEINVKDAQKTISSLLVSVSSDRIKEVADDDISSDDGLGVRGERRKGNG